MTDRTAHPLADAALPVTVPWSTAPRPRPFAGPHVELDASFPAARLRRIERLREDRAGVLVRDPDDPDDAGLVAALRVALTLLPEPASVPADAGWEALAEAFGLACADDLVVLRRRGPGRATAELLAVAFPSGWPPRLRAGADLPSLHAPVADGERLRRASVALTEAMLTKGPYVQAVWGLDPDGRLDRDPSAPDAATHTSPPPQHWWLRTERQCTLPLPGLDRALFLIAPRLTPLTALTGAQRRLVADAVETMSAQALEYKGIADVRGDLLAWLRAGDAPRGDQLSAGSSG